MADYQPSSTLSNSSSNQGTLHRRRAATIRQVAKTDRPVAVKAGKTDNSVILGSATASMPMQDHSSTRTAMAVPLMTPTPDSNNNTITEPATPALPAVLPDRIPLEDAIRLLVGTESKDDPSLHVHVNSPVATTARSPTSVFPKARGQSSSGTSTGKMEQSSGGSSSDLLPTSQSTRLGDKRSKKRARTGADTGTGKRFKPQSSLTLMYSTCEPVDVFDASYNEKKDDGFDGYETPTLSLSRSDDGLWHSCKPVNSLSRQPPLPPLYRPRPPGLEHVQDSPPPTSPGSPRHPSFPLHPSLPQSRRSGGPRLPVTVHLHMSRPHGGQVPELPVDRAVPLDRLRAVRYG
ncbi:uncharacterized protein LOC118406823 isoform X2 [Branchiostoma floridae]|uniref:Uncharacterized protein LOC118406823 isoform X2 n=1 Tax=Branchiostoma floridae TaxID=7739 RepID=A0A9J7HPC3_BRAFL|nr:uncharacterized protein LOC118406823 isoform X2 [Branchiostoma floridae]